MIVPDILTRSRDVDTLFEKLHRNYDLTKIKAIGGAAQVRYCHNKHDYVLILSLARPGLVEINHSAIIIFLGPISPYILIFLQIHFLFRIPL
jgi:hypothetical protein